MCFPMSPLASENLISLDRFGRPVSRQPDRSLHQGLIWCSSRDSSSFPRRRPHNRQPPSGQSPQLRTEGLHCREVTATGPVVLKIVPVTGAAFPGFTMGQLFMRLSFPTPTIGMYVMDIYNSMFVRFKG